MGHKEGQKQKPENKHNIVKNLNWGEANQLAIYKREREVALRSIKNKCSLRSGRTLISGPPDCNFSAQIELLVASNRSADYSEKETVISISPKFSKSCFVFQFC